MHQPAPHLIFATHFSESCYAAIPLVAHWVDSLQARLTLLHVPVRGSREQARQALDSFFAEAAAYPACERVLGAGDAEDGIVEVCRRHPQALLVMPPSDRTGLPRLLHASLRARVLQRIANPMLTLPQARAGRLPYAGGGPVACWLDGPDAHMEHLHQAIALARRQRAPLHLLHVLPEIGEGLLVTSVTTTAPLGEASARHWLERIVDDLAPDLPVKLGIGSGDPARELPRLLARSGARTLVMRPQAAVSGYRWRPMIEPALARCECLLVCVPARQDVAEKPRRQEALELDYA